MSSSLIECTKSIALVIQWTEWKSSKLTVAGSSPAKGTNASVAQLD